MASSPTFLDAPFFITDDLSEFLADTGFPQELIVAGLGDGKHLVINCDTKGMEPDPQVFDALAVFETEDGIGDTLQRLTFRGTVGVVKPEHLKLDACVELARSKNLRALVLQREGRTKAVYYVN